MSKFVAKTTCLRKDECVRYRRKSCTYQTQYDCRMDGHRNFLIRPPELLAVGVYNHPDKDDNFVPTKSKSILEV